MINLLSQHCIVFRSNHVGDEWFEQVITQLVLSHSLAKELFVQIVFVVFNISHDYHKWENLLPSGKILYLMQ